MGAHIRGAGAELHATARQMLRYPGLELLFPRAVSHETQADLGMPLTQQREALQQRQMIFVPGQTCHADDERRTPRRRGLRRHEALRVHTVGHIGQPCGRDAQAGKDVGERLGITDHVIRQAPEETLVLPAWRAAAAHRAHHGDPQQPPPDAAPDVGQGRAGDEDIGRQTLEGCGHERKEKGVHLAAVPQICHADTGLFDLCIKVRPAGEDSMETRKRVLSRRQASSTIWRWVPPKQRSSMTKSTCILSDMGASSCIPGKFASP